MNGTSLKTQLYGLSFIFLLPILLLAGLLAEKANSDIGFSAKEREGVAYLRSLFPIVARPSEHANPATVKRLTQVAVKYDSSTKSWEPSTAFRVGLATNIDDAARIERGVKLIAAIGDGSNLILDPDLDSYYIMDTVIARLPTLLEEFAKVTQELRSGSLDAGSRERIAILRGHIAITRKGLEASTFAALRNNASGEVSARIASRYSTLISALDAQTKLIDQLLATPNGVQANPALINTLLRNDVPVRRNITVAYGAYLGMLDHLLEHRIIEKRQFLYTSLATSLLVALLALGLALLIVRRIRSNVSALSERIERMTEGDVTSPIPLQYQSDELGKIARSLNIFREHADERAVLTKTIEDERIAATLQMEKLAYHDDLTGLPNRKLLNLRIREHIEADLGGTSALIYLDLDGFKEVNDTMTHVAGDAVLREVADRLNNFTRGKELVARLGGDEFAIFLPITPDHDSLMEYVRKVLLQIVEPYRVQDTMQFLSASAGIAILPLLAQHDAFELVRRSDVAMYRAKALGKNQAAVFDPTFDAESLKRAELETALRDAVTNERIKLFFQPQFDVATSKLVGVEGLARWTHSRLGEISPSTFIPIAETCGLIHQLGRQVLRQALIAVHRWPNLRISINLSVAQLRHHQFMNDITMLAAELGPAVRRLELEITESVLMDDNPLVATKLEALRSMGFELALDDFGTGYSSLGYLSRYHFDRLKIDRAFVVAAQKDERGAKLLSSIAAMGRELGMDVCAEGVETYEGLESAAKAGCNILQGFYFSPAVEMVDIDLMLESGIGETAPKNIDHADEEILPMQKVA